MGIGTLAGGKEWLEENKRQGIWASLHFKLQYNSQQNILLFVWYLAELSAEMSSVVIWFSIPLLLIPLQYVVSPIPSVQDNLSFLVHISLAHFPERKQFSCIQKSYRPNQSLTEDPGHNEGCQNKSCSGYPTCCCLSSLIFRVKRHKHLRQGAVYGLNSKIRRENKHSSGREGRSREVENSSLQSAHLIIRESSSTRMTYREDKCATYCQNGWSHQSMFAAAVVEGCTAKTEKYVQAEQARTRGRVSRHIKRQRRIENILSDARQILSIGCIHLVFYLLQYDRGGINTVRRNYEVLRRRRRVKFGTPLISPPTRTG